nr:CoA transferase [Sphingomonas tagetis]
MLEDAREHVTAFLGQFRKSELMQIALDRGIRIAPIQNIADLLSSEQFAARDFFATVTAPQGSYTLPWAFASGCPEAFTAPAPAPALGEHRDEVLAQWNAAPITPQADATRRPATPACQGARPGLGGGGTADRAQPRRLWGDGHLCGIVEAR